MRFSSKTRSLTQEVTTPIEYQVWSTVLGKAVMTLYASGYKKEVSVYAGGMQIAVQASGDTGGSDTINWPVSDPVTGTHAYLGGISSAIDEEREPMGQLIALTDPGVPPPPATAPGKGSAGDPEWQCILEQSRTNGFSGPPLPCFEKYASLEGSQGNIPKSSPEEITNPHYGTGKGPRPTLKHSEKLSAGDLERLRALASTGKYDEGGIRGRMNSDIDRGPHPGSEQLLFEIDPKLFDIAGHRLEMLAQQLTYMGRSECAKAFHDANLESPQEQIEKGLTIMSEDFLGNPYNDAQWAPSKEYANELRTYRNMHPGTQDVTQIGPYKGRRYMVLTGRVFTQADDNFSVGVAHSFIHSGGGPGNMDALWTVPVKNISVKTGKELPGFPPGKLDVLPLHDLEYYGEAYNEIIRNCTPEGSSRKGPARTRK